MAKSISKAELQTALSVMALASAATGAAGMTAEAAENNEYDDVAEQNEASYVETETTTFELLRDARLAKKEALMDENVISAVIEAYDDDTFDLVVMRVLTTAEAATVSTVYVPVPAMPKLSDLTVVEIEEKAAEAAYSRVHSGPVANMVAALTFLSTL